MAERATSAPIELLRALAALAEPPGAGVAALTDALGLGEPPVRSEYTDVFVFQLYPYASVHLGPEGMLGGEARDRIAGFWRAVARTPPAEPDHLASLLGLYAALAEQGDEAAGAEAALLAESRAALLHEHVAPWVFGFLGRCRELTTGFYARWAELLDSVLRRAVEQDLARSGRGLALHLRLAPPLPDPRAGGAEDFASALLAPVRSGAIVTRADLAGVSSRLELGLRAGERRYALEHLLSQAPGAVLRALAAEAGRQGGHHLERVSWLGDAAAFLAGRAERTAELLEALALDADAAA